jgi:murein DD-endopeptidase MepM/ murein hydrolase activator NlpD
MEEGCFNIDCSIHDELEAYATQGTKVKFQFLQDGKLNTATSKIKTFTTRDGIERLETSDGQLIRLDHLVFANQIHIANPFFAKVSRVKKALQTLTPAQLLNVPATDLIHIDLSKSNTALNTIDISDIDAQHRYIFGEIAQQNGVGAVGGYGEYRQWYQRNSTDFGNGDEARVIHIGTDVWLPTKTPLYAPLAGKIHSFANNDGEANYGPTIILEHSPSDDTFYTLYGHLSLDSLKNIEVGQRFEAGELLGFIGNPNENGGWPPHVHVQAMVDMLGLQGDFPGVCRHYETKFYLDFCLNPALLGL